MTLVRRSNRSFNGAHDVFQILSHLSICVGNTKKKTNNNNKKYKRLTNQKFLWKTFNKSLFAAGAARFISKHGNILTL